MDVRGFLARILERPRVVAFRTVLDTYGRAAGGLLANGLAFAALFAAIPTTLLVLGLAGWFAAGDPTIQERVVNALSTALPAAGRADPRARSTVIADGAALTSVVGAVGVVWTVSQLFAAVDMAFARIFFDEPERDVFRRTLRGFVVVGLIAATVIGAIVTLGLLAALDTVSGNEGSLARATLELLGSPPFLVLAACLVVIAAYRTLPPRSPSWRSLVIPAVIVGVILVMLGQVFMLLVPWLVGVAELRGRSRPGSSPSPGCRSRSRRCCSGRRGSGFATPACRPRRRLQRPRPGQRAWGVPQRRQNRAVAESDRPQLMHGWIPLAALPGDRRRGDQFLVRRGPEGVDPALRRGRSAEERQARRGVRARPLGLGRPLRLAAPGGRGARLAGTDGRPVVAGCGGRCAVGSGAVIRHVGCSTTSAAAAATGGAAGSRGPGPAPARGASRGDGLRRGARRHRLARARGRLGARRLRPRRRPARLGGVGCRLPRPRARPPAHGSSDAAASARPAARQGRPSARLLRWPARRTARATFALVGVQLGIEALARPEALEQAERLRGRLVRRHRRSVGDAIGRRRRRSTRFSRRSRRRRRLAAPSADRLDRSAAAGDSVDVADRCLGVGAAACQSSAISGCGLDRTAIRRSTRSGSATGRPGSRRRPRWPATPLVGAASRPGRRRRSAGQVVDVGGRSRLRERRARQARPRPRSSSSGRCTAGTTCRS